MLLEQYHFDVNQTDDTNCTPLGCAVSGIATKNHSDQLYFRLIDRLLQQLGADIESSVQSGATPLCVILGSSCTHGLIIDQLLNHGASLPDKKFLSRCNNGNTLKRLGVHIATARNWTQNVQKYLRSKKVPSELPKDIVQMIIKFVTNTIISDQVLKAVADDNEPDDDMLSEAHRQMQAVVHDKHGCCTIL